jgi:DNA-binding transcriptional MerR regulator
MYSIGLASRKSGVPAETIRIWERRYGIPDPQRTPGGHRKYSDDDVELLRALKTLTDGGVRIGGLAAQTREAILEAAKLQQTRVGEPARAAEEDFDYAALIADVIEAARRRDARAAAEALDRPLLHRHARDVILGLYLPALHEVGELWHAGELDVASEHFIEKEITGRIHSVRVNRPDSEGGATALLACVPEERHEAALLAAAVLLEMRGFDVTYLGADLPTEELVRAVRALRPRFVVLASTVPMNVEAQDRLVEALTDPALEDVPVLVGGAGASALELASGRRTTTVDSLVELEEIAARFASAS